MAKKAKKKARTRDDKDEQNEHPDNGTEVYDESEDDEDWVEDDKAASTPATTEAPEAYAGMTEEQTRQMPEAATTEAPPDPKDQPPVPKDYDVLINDPPFQPADEPEAQEKYAEPPAPQSPVLAGETKELQPQKER